MVAVSKIVIAGGGIVGNSIAYYITKSRPDVSVVLVDPVGIAPGASSKAGGFLAKEWRDGTPLESMQRLGFDLHQELADELGADNIGYRRLTCYSVDVDADADVDTDHNGKGSETDEENVKLWADLNVIGRCKMGDEDVIAQVHPRKLCEAMWEEVSKSPASTELRKGRIVKALTDPARAHEDSLTDHPSEFIVTGVLLEDGSIIEADTLVVACGPWTEEAREWFPSGRQIIPEITGVKCHSMLVQPKSKDVYDQGVFFYTPNHESILFEADLEVYPRPDGDCYVNGFEDDEGIVLERPGEEEVVDEKVKLMKEAMKLTSSQLGGVDPHTTQVSKLHSYQG